MDANSILPGGCYPVPYPPKEPEPDSLDEQVDWMTYAHEELYRMVHQGLDLAGATSVAADWARLGEALGEIGDELNRIGQEFSSAWQGDAAEQARHAFASLTTWAQETAPNATQVSGLISMEVDNAMRARDAMPAPLPSPAPDPRGPVPPHAATAFTDPGFGSANVLVTDPTAIVSQGQQRHQQAAETMERFQADSRDVYDTVPQFTAPTVGPKPLGRDNPPPPPTTPQQTPDAPPPDPGRGPAAPVAAGGGGSPSPAPVPAQSPPPGPAPRATPSPGPGPGTGQAPGESPAQSKPAAAASAGKPGGGGGAMGGMPMGGMGGAPKEEDRERKSPAYIKEDGDIWGLGDHVVAPPVLGEDEYRA